MILRRVIAHFRKQEWTAIAIDFVIVVVGVFVGLQVNNWNEARAFRERETELLIALRRELETSVVATAQKADAIQQVADAGLRSLDFIAARQSCGDKCWRVLVDFYHASQWQSIEVDRSAYDDMRRLGLPKSQEIVDAVDDYLAQNASLANTMIELPEYRALVRQFIPARAQAFYWGNCYDLSGGLETYSLDCPEGLSNDAAALAVERIAGDPDIERQLTLWTGLILGNPAEMSDQIETAKLAIEKVDAELERRK
jgi:hypothetical protein